MIDPRRPNFASHPVWHDRPRFGYRREADGVNANGWVPAATVVTPYYNVGPIFHETARNVLGQSLQNFEWIIVNDASTKHLGELEPYRAMAKVDPRVRVIDHAHNHGLSAARNTGFRAARSGFVFMIDGDDLIEPTAVEKCLLTLLCNPEFAFSHGWSVGFGGQTYLWEKGFHNTSAFLDENLTTATGMVRTSVHRAVGGFDETIRAGMEDWEFWLRCAEHGHWGTIIPEYLDWYRRRPRQHSDWGNLASSTAREKFLAEMRRRFPKIYSGGFPTPSRRWHMPFDDVPESIDVTNPLSKAKPRLMMIVPWLRMGGADRFNLDLARYVTGAGWEVTIATTLSGHHWLSDFAQVTPDVFMLGHYAQPTWYPALLRYLIESRTPDVVMVSNSELGYMLLPYLRSHCPAPAYVDFNHMEEPHWHNGGHPRAGVGYQSQLDLNVVVSHHLKRWMVERGGEHERIEVCHINADAAVFKPDTSKRASVRDELGITPDRTVILYAARLCPQKQPQVFARTMELLAERRHDVVALVAGDGEQEGELRDRLRSAGLLWESAAAPADRSCVKMLGSVPAGTMPSLFAACDIFFLPSLWEGIAMSFYEAMAAGLAILGADVGGQRELVTQDCGVLLPRPENNPEREAVAYANTLDNLLSDPQRVRTLGKAARRRIQEHFQLANMGRRMLELFEIAQHNHRQLPRERVPIPLAREIALQGVECVRVHELADYLWPYRDRFYAQKREEASRPQQAVLEELHRLERSVSFRVANAAKRTSAYRAIARRRFGPNWELIEPKDNHAARLAYIKASRVYRAVQLVKRTPIYPAYMLGKKLVTKKR